MTQDKPKLSPLAAEIVADIRRQGDPEFATGVALVARLLALALTQPAEAARVLNEIADNSR